MMRINLSDVLILLAFMITEYQCGLMSCNTEFPTVDCVREKAGNAIREIDEVIGSLKTIKAWAIQHHKRMNTAKTVGTTFGTIGTVGSLIGNILAIFTGGVSFLVVTLPSMAASFSGEFTTSTAKIIDIPKTKEYNENAYKLLAKAHDALTNLEDEIIVAYKLIEAVKTRIVKNSGLETNTIEEIFEQLAEDRLKFFVATLSDTDVEFYNTVELTKLLGKPDPELKSRKFVSKLKMEMKIIKKIIPPTKDLLKRVRAIRNDIKFAKPVFSSALGLNIFDIGQSLIDIKELISLWKSDHPSLAVINSCIDKVVKIRPLVFEIIIKLDNNACR